MAPTPDGGRRAWLREVGRAAAATAGASPADVIVSVARRLDPSFPERGLRLRGRPIDVPPLPAGAGPEILGTVHESLVGGDLRHRAGVHYTPPAIARRLSEIALDGLIDPTVDVCDPACGGGAFLLAAGAVLDGHGFDRRDIVEHRLWGIDLDPLAVAVTEAALYLWSGTVPADHLAVADALHDPWPATGFAAVIGNPPFQNQLGGTTARSRDSATRLRQRFGDLIGPYTDSASVFLAAAARAVRPGGRVVLVQPQSVLSARDAAALRRQLPLEGLWLTDEPVFSASVRVCAPVIRTGPPDRPHRTVRPNRWSGPDVLALPPAESRALSDDGSDWSGLAAGILEIPDPDLPEDRRLGDVATATAGFRDQFYGLAGFVVEDGDGDRHLPRLVTSGIIDPGRVAWGERPVRFAGRRWLAPVVDTGALRATGRPAVARWVDDRLVPKVVVATQSRVVEAAVDHDGGWVPSTPVISVAAPAERLDHVAAVLLSPPVTAWALRRYAGSALVTGAVKLAARQVLEVPLPAAVADWDAAARLVAEVPYAIDDHDRRRLLLAAGDRMIAAYRLGRTGDDLLGWWSDRLRA
jgi:hypothetical protein